MAYVAKNAEFLQAYSDYLVTNNKTQANTTVFASINGDTMPIDTDMFFDYLVNKIALSVVSSHTFNDPLEFLYGQQLSIGFSIEDTRTVLEGEETEYGTIEFDTDVTNPYIKKKSKVSTVWHRVSSHKTLKVTCTEAQIQEAVITEGRISALMNTIIDDLRVQYNAWSYRDKRNALTSLDYATIVPYSDYAEFSLKVKNIVADFTDFDNSYKYNKRALYSPMATSDIAVIISKKYQNEVDINYFTGLFNVSYAELKGNIHYINEFPNGATCMIFDKRGTHFHKTLDVAKRLENGADLTYNYWVHFWRMHSVSPHYNAVMLMSADKAGAISSTGSVITKGTSVPLKSLFTIDGNDTAYRVTYDGSIPEDTGDELSQEMYDTVPVNKNLADSIGVATVTIKGSTTKAIATTIVRFV